MSTKKINNTSGGVNPSGITMDELLAKSSQRVRRFKFGQKITAKISEISDKYVSFDIGGKTEAYVIGQNFDEAYQYIKQLKPGDSVEAVVVDAEYKDGSVRLSLRQAASQSLWVRLYKIYEDDTDVSVVVRGVSDKGVSVEYEGVSGFIPSSQLGKEKLSSIDSLLGSHLRVKILELDKDKRRVVFSERAVSEEADMTLIAQALTSVVPHEDYDGTVTQVTGFGIFVQILVSVGETSVPVEGLVHVSELSWEKTVVPSSLYRPGDKVKVRVMGVKDGKLALSIKQLSQDPWVSASEKYISEKKVSGKVSRVSTFGVFVELEPGIEGLIHVTKIPPGTDLQVGKSVECYIEEVSVADRKISLGLLLTSKPVGYK